MTRFGSGLEVGIGVSLGLVAGAVVVVAATLAENRLRAAVAA